MFQSHRRPQRTTTRARLPLAAALLCILAAIPLSACGAPTVGAMRGCVIVDVSGSALPEIVTTYEPGLTAFVQRMATKGSGKVCFAFAAKGLSGGTSGWANMQCANPRDRLRCEPEIRVKAAAAAAQLSAVASRSNSLSGASELAEALSVVAGATKSGDEILMLTDAIEHSPLLGNFAAHEENLDETAIEALIDRLQQHRLLPNLAGQTLRMPYALTHNARPLGMSAERQQEIRAFWQRYAQRTGAQLVFGGGTPAA